MPTFNTQDSKGVLSTTTVTIANGTALSAAVDLTAFTLVAIQLPAGWTAASLTFQAANDNQNFGDVYDKSGEYTFLAVDVSRYLVCDPTAFAGIRYLKVRSGTGAAPVNQGADRVLTLILRGL
jgi:hypothetical protein